MESAEDEARRLEEALQVANARLERVIARYLAALDQAEAEAHELTAVRTEVRLAAARITDMTRQFGLSRPVPSATGLSTIDAKRAHLVGLLLSEAAYVCSTRRRKPGVCTNTLTLPMEEADNNILSILEDEVLSPGFIDALMALVDATPDEGARLTAERDQ